MSYNKNNQPNQSKKVIKKEVIPNCHWRFVAKNINKKDMYKKISISPRKLRKAKSLDLVKIKKYLGYSLTLEAFNRSGAKIFERGTNYGIAFHKNFIKSDIVFNLCKNNNNKEISLHVEGRDNYLIAFELGLDEDFIIHSDYSLNTRIRIKGVHYFLLNKNTDIDEKIKHIVAYGFSTIKFIYPSGDYSDLTDWHNQGKCTKDDILNLLGNADSIDIKPSSKLGTDIPTIKEYLKNEMIITIIGKFYKYTNGYYKKMSRTSIIIKVSEELQKEVDELNLFNIRKGKKVIKVTKTMVENVVYFLQHLSEKEDTEEDSMRYLNFENILLDMREMKFVNHSPTIYSTIRIPVKYDKKATCENWESFLESSIPSEADRKALQEYIGYSLSRSTKFHKAVFLLGDGENGKGVFTDTIKKLFGKENIANIDIADMNNPERTTMLYNKLLNISSEMVDPIGKRAFKLFKQAISFDELLCHFLFTDHFAFISTAKMIFSANRIPTFPEHNRATFRRIVFIRFPNTFSPESGKRIENLREILESELSGILNWALKGYYRLLKQSDFTQDTESKNFMDNFTVSNDPVGEFVKECCILDDSIIPKSVIVSAFRDFCDEYGIKEKSAVTLGRGLKGRFAVTDNRKVIDGVKIPHYVGIGLKDLIDIESDLENEILDFPLD